MDAVRGSVGRKGDLTVDGRPLARRAAAALFPHCGSVLISIAQGAENPAPEWPSVEDLPPPGRGPLAGIAAAFTATADADLLVLACDYPRVGPELIAAIAGMPLDHDDDLVMPTDRAGRDHPLVAAWSRRMQPIVENALDEGRFRVHGLFPDLPGATVEAGSASGRRSRRGVAQRELPDRPRVLRRRLREPLERPA